MESEFPNKGRKVPKHWEGLDHVSLGDGGKQGGVCPQAVTLQSPHPAHLQHLCSLHPKPPPTPPAASDHKAQGSDRWEGVGMNYLTL